MIKTDFSTKKHWKTLLEGKH